MSETMTNDTRLRRCTPGDESALALVGGATFLETFAGILDGEAIVAHCRHAHSVEQYAAWLASDGHAAWLLECHPGRAPVGYMVLAPAQLPLPDTTGDLELKRIYLLDRFRGGGLGTQLVSTAIAHAAGAGARRLLLGVYAHNAPAIRFYERTGFTRLGKRRFRVGNEDYDDHIMGRVLGA